ncbi:pilus assembly protein [Labrenzia aggregata]|uniref:Pilus assembly protein n=2 Tax=Roseibium aggregatum TaxID=187304 RepID=A0A939EA41_9HYPH|nr:pilus assembly protein [Roseibium aggregatum]
MHLRRLHMWPFGKKKARSLLKDERGVTAIEFAFVALPFFILCIGIIEVGLAHLVNRMLDNAVITAARTIKTGQAAEGSTSKAEFEQLICDSMPAFMCNLDRITLEVTTYETFEAAGNFNSLYDTDGKLRDEEDITYEIGEASSIVVVNVIYSWPMMTSLLSLDPADDGSYRNLSSTLVFRNEPWD